MCNFIIRPVKAFAAIDVDGKVKCGEAFTVTSVENGDVVGDTKDAKNIRIAIATYIHTFTLQDPAEKKKEDKKK